MTSARTYFLTFIVTFAVGILFQRGMQTDTRPTNFVEMEEPQVVVDPDLLSENFPPAFAGVEDKTPEPIEEKAPLQGQSPPLSRASESG